MQKSEHRKRHIVEIGHAIFKRKSPKQFYGMFLDQQKRQILSQQCLKVPNFYFFQDGWEKVFEYIIQSKHEGLQLQFCQLEYVPQSVYKIQYKNLKVLNIHANYLDNSEFINFFDCPLLEELYLSYNQLVNSKALDKVKFSFLKIINLLPNYTKQLSFHRLKTSEMAKSLIDQTYWSCYRLFQDISVLVKAECKLMQETKIDSQLRRIHQRKVGDAIQRKTMKQIIFTGESL